ncbi:MAG: hypothetical protein KDA72_21935 [Planctomycetales bacterium]|nr:hypothetical protein [Planctomycetales bacterium]
MACMSTLLLAGCGDGVHRVNITGVLTVQKKPIDGAVLQLIPKGTTSGDGGIGGADRDGKFTVVSSRGEHPGIPPGTYTVLVSRLVDQDGTLLPEGAGQAEYPDGFDSVPPPYSTGNSPLEITVTDENKTFEIDVPVALRTSLRR